MKRILLILIGIASVAAAEAKVQKTAKGVTFTVDRNLPKASVDRGYPRSADEVTVYWLHESGVKDATPTACSFRDDTLFNIGRDVLYKTIVKSYGEHRPLVLSPDMIWLNICQVFGQHVRDNAEALRDRLVVHDGRMELTVKTTDDMLAADADWGKVIAGFIGQIGENTREGVVQTLEADFSTTGINERIASDITIMDAMHPYFNYVVMRIVCGIPSVTLTGTPSDWKKLQRKTRELAKYDMEWFTSDIDPILKEFVKASKGRPNAKFWQNMVRKDRPDRLKGEGCSFEDPTVFDGWFTKLFPYQRNGERAATHTNKSQMLPAMARTDVRYIDTVTQTETPMELFAGFTGVREDAATKALVPQIGWFIVTID